MDHLPDEQSIGDHNPLPRPVRVSPAAHHGALQGGPETELPPRPSIPESTSHSVFPKMAWLIATAAVFFGAWWLGPRLVEDYQYASTKARIQAEYDVATVALKDSPLDNLSMAYQMVARRIRPSVVHIATVAKEVPEPNRFRSPFDIDSPLTEGQGSGVIVSDDGYILTNEHVIRDAAKITVILSDRRDYEARLIGVDTHTDLAVLKIKEKGLIPAEWGNSDQLEVGSMVWAVGSPFGLEQSITFGIISAKHRKTNSNPYQDLLQSDAAVNPGNSGGPLVNAMGEVIGINTSIVGNTYQGISFSVPSSLAEPIFERIRNNGQVVRGFLGVSPGLVTHSIAQTHSMPDLNGAYLLRVEPNSPAYEGGLRPGDVITAWNGIPIKNDILLFRHVGLTPINSEAVVAFRRGTEEYETTVVVNEKPRDPRFDRRR